MQVDRTRNFYRIAASAIWKTTYAAPSFRKIFDRGLRFVVIVGPAHVMHWTEKVSRPVECRVHPDAGLAFGCLLQRGFVSARRFFGSGFLRLLGFALTSLANGFCRVHAAFAAGEKSLPWRPQRRVGGGKK